MNTTMRLIRRRVLVVAALFCGAWCSVLRAAPVGTGFTWQGQLKQNGMVVNDLIDLEATLWTAAVDGDQVGPTLIFDGIGGNPLPVEVVNGLFTVTLDFGPGAFDGTGRWLALAVRIPAGSPDPMIDLTPRQLITPAPIALSLPGLYTQENATSPNVIGGFSGNFVEPGVVGATIGGGGNEIIINRVSANYGTVAGGLFNTASGGNSTIGGGRRNRASGLESTVGGGNVNEANGKWSTIGGGSNNEADGDISTVGGGGSNWAIGEASTIGGGHRNETRGEGSTVGGGVANVVSGESSTIGGGASNSTFGFAATVSGGEFNTANGLRSTVGGGWFNTASGEKSTIGGGSFNWAESHAATVGGGDGNVAGERWSTVGGGLGNWASGPGSAVGGGLGNEGRGESSTVGGGERNTASGWISTVGGGQWNTASGWISNVGGGTFNTASGAGSTVGGGGDNTASGIFTAVPGGNQNQAGGDYSFAAGRNAIIRDAAQAGNSTGDQGTFMWADSTPADFASDGQNRFLVRASGGTVFYSDSDLTAGVSLAAGGGSWLSVSDRDLKENVEPVDGREVLERLSRVPIATWNYKAQDASIRHMGPMGQDFHEVFGLGDEPPRIATIDADGVALAAIQGLYEIIQEKDCEIEELREHKSREIDELKSQIAELRTLVHGLALQNGGVR